MKTFAHVGDAQIFPWRAGCLRVERACDGFKVYTIFYVKDATREEAARAIAAVEQMRHSRLFFEGDVSSAEAYAHDNGMKIAT
jgi:hypothetical protein